MQALADSLPAWNTAPRAAENLQSWIAYLETKGVFFSSPLDLDLMMIEAFPDAYGVNAIFDLGPPDAGAARAVLGKQHDVFADQYTPGQQHLFDAYHDRFKVGSKPAHHVEALAALDDAALLAGVPAVLGRLIDSVATRLEALPE